MVAPTPPYRSRRIPGMAIRTLNPVRAGGFADASMNTAFDQPPILSGSTEGRSGAGAHSTGHGRTLAHRTKTMAIK
ncbi:hypothetical protein [Nocardia sp. NPDC004260]